MTTYVHNRCMLVLVLVSVLVLSSFHRPCILVRMTTRTILNLNLLIFVKYFRYFVLRGGELRYYTDASKKKAKGVLHLCANDIAKPSDYPGRSYVFCVQTVDRVLELQAEGEGGMKSWMKAIRIVVEMGVGSERKTGTRKSGPRTNSDLYIDDDDSDDDMRESEAMGTCTEVPQSGRVNEINDNVVHSVHSKDHSACRKKKVSVIDSDDENSEGDHDPLSKDSDDEDSGSDGSIDVSVAVPKDLVSNDTETNVTGQIDISGEVELEVRDSMKSVNKADSDVNVDICSQSQENLVTKENNANSQIHDSDDIEIVGGGDVKNISETNTSVYVDIAPQHDACSSQLEGLVENKGSPNGGRVAPYREDWHEEERGNTLPDMPIDDDLPSKNVNENTTSDKDSTPANGTCIVNKNSNNSCNKNSESLKIYHGSILEQQEEQKARLMFLKSLTLKDFGISHDESSPRGNDKKIIFDNAVQVQQEIDSEKMRLLREAHMRDFGISEEEADYHTKKLAFEKSIEEQIERECRRIEALREGTLKDFGINSEGSSEKTSLTFEIAMQQQKERERLRREFLRNETLEDFGISGKNAAHRRSSVADVAKQFGGSKKKLTTILPPPPSP